MNEVKSPLYHLDYVYKVLSMISAMYDKALEFEYLEQRKKIWQSALYSIIESVEGFYEIWEVANRELVYGVPAETLPKSLHLLEKSCTRVELIWTRIGPWTGVSRFPKLLLAAEAYSLESLRRLAEHYHCDIEELCGVMDQHLGRINELKILAGLFDKEQQRLKNLPKNLFS